MQQGLLRLISAICVAAYFLANTQAALALEYLHRTIGTPPRAETPAKKPRKCKHCCKAEPAKKLPTSKAPCKSSCPCDSKEPCQKCPGCALCSVANAPCVTDAAMTLHEEAYLGESCRDESFDYVSPFQRGLIRPPRV